MTPIAIPRDLLEAIYAHAIAAFPDECCGYLVGAAPAAVDTDAGAVDTVVACRNAQADGEHPIAPERGADTGFVISGAELLAFARSFDTARPARIVYHSHTHGRAYLSAVDRAMAATPAGPSYPVQHLVIGVAADPAPASAAAETAAAEIAAAGTATAGTATAGTATAGTATAGTAGAPTAGTAKPAFTEAAQFAWSDAARDYVEVARWTVDAAGRPTATRGARP